MQFQCPGMVIEELLFSSVIIKTEIVASKEVTPNKFFTLQINLSVD